MYLYFIRHGKPNYKIDRLVPEGWEQARAVAPRMKKIFCAALSFRQAKNRRFAQIHITKKAVHTGKRRVCFRFVSCVTQGKIVTVMRKNETCSFGLIMALRTQRRIAICLLLQKNRII